MSTGIMQATALRPDRAHLDLPFFDAAHRRIAAALPGWANAQRVDERDDRAACRDWVRRLGDGGWLKYCVPGDRRRAAAARLARAGAAARDAGLPLAAGRLRLCHAGAGQRRHLAGRQRGQRRAYLPAVAAGARSRRLRCPSPRPARTWPP
jgi:acyl-CoA dehydrogenase